MYVNQKIPSVWTQAHFTVATSGNPLAEGLEKPDFSIFTISLGKDEIHNIGCDADEREATLEARRRLEEIKAALPVDHRRIMLVAMEQADDVVALQGRQ